VSQRYDAVVIGAGPNGLAAAVRLAEAGRSVLVLEAAGTVGGGTRSAELTLPGFVHDVCATVQSLAVDAPALSLDRLGRHGLRWIVPDIAIAHPLEGGRAAVLRRSVEDTAAGLGVDGRAWQRLFAPIVEQWPQLSQQLLGPLLSVPRHPLMLGRFGLKAMQPATLLVRRFRSEEGRALFGGCAAHAMLRLDRPFTAAFGLAMAGSAHAHGWPIVAGGSQMVADALLARLTELGGEVRTGVRVRALDELPEHRAVLFDTNPAQLASIAGDALPPGYRKRLLQFRHGPGSFKVDYALDAPVPWLNEHCRRAGTVHVVGTFEELRAAEAEAAAGRMPARPLVLAVQASLFDPARAPEGKHTLWAYAHVPHGWPGDATQIIEDQIERFAPGFRDVVAARHTISARELQAYNANYVGGDIAGGAHSGFQLLFRPTPSLHPYATPNPSLFLCSASSPPGAGVHGMCGWHAAERALAGTLRTAS
jgi:phytoene dehydrogenase-like protein